MTALESTEMPPPPALADLGRLMRPASIAVVGATDRAGSYAAETLVNLELIGFRGPVYGVNPKRTEVMGRVCVPSVAELPEPVDAVVVAIPAAGVAAAIDQAGERGCGGAVVFSAGFAEVESGRGHHDALVAAARRHGLPVCGPNCNGIVSPHSRTALWGDAFSRMTRARPGRARLPERQRRRQRARHPPRAALPHRDRQRQPGGAVRR